jgi:hypothetical protein
MTINDINTSLQKYFKSKKVSKKTTINYLSDINSFLSWMEKKQTTDSKDTLSKIDSQVAYDYMDYLLEKNTPELTINRKLSSLRLFSKFLQSKKYKSFDFMKDVQNIKRQKTPASQSRNYLTPALFFLSLSVLISAIILSNLTRTTNDRLASDIDYIKNNNYQIPQNLVQGSQLKLTADQKDLDKYKSTSLGPGNQVNLALSSPVNDSSVLQDQTIETDVKGKDAIPTGSKEVTINNPYINGFSEILLTPTSMPYGQVLYIKNQGNGYFTVAIERNAQNKIEFNWLAK